MVVLVLSLVHLFFVTFLSNSVALSFHIDTRWLYDYNILKFIIKHKNDIIKFVQNFPEEEFQHLIKVLTIFKYLILKFETPKTCFSSAFIILERAINSLFELSNDYSNPYAKFLAKSLQDYTLHSEEGGIWALGYCLTPKGILDFHNRNQTRQNPLPKDCIKYFHFENNEDDDTDDEVSEILMSENEEVLMTLDGKEYSPLDDTLNNETETQT